MSHLHAHDSPDLDDESRFRIAVLTGIAARLTEDGHRVSYHELELGAPTTHQSRTSPGKFTARPHIELNRKHSSIFFSCASNTSDEICATVFIIGNTDRTKGVRFKISDPDLYDKISEFAAKF